MSAAWLAWIMWTLSISLTVPSLWLLILNLSHPNVPRLSLLGGRHHPGGGLLDGRGCGGLLQTLESRRLGAMFHRLGVGSGSLHQRVCHLRAAGSARVAPGC
jgi:hypothetical protein